MRLYVSDLDGTLLHRDGTLAASTRDGLNALLDAGMLFTVASARSAFSMRKLLDGLRLRLPVIEHNGAYVTDLWGDQTLVSRPLCQKAGEALVQAGLQAGIAPVVSTFTGSEQRLYVPTERLNGGQQWFWEDRRRAGDHRVRPYATPDELPDETLMGLTFIGPQAVLSPMAAQAAAQGALPSPVQSYFYQNNYNPGWHWLTCHAPEATKAHGIRFVAERLGVPLSSVTVFGDEINDLPMFDAAGEAVAVDNAVPAVKRRADRVIGVPEDDAVLRFLQAAHAGDGQ